MTIHHHGVLFQLKQVLKIEGQSFDSLFIDSLSADIAKSTSLGTLILITKSTVTSECTNVPIVLRSTSKCHADI